VSLAKLTPAQLARLSESERAEIAAAIAAHERASESILDFVVRTSPNYSRPSHLGRIAATIERVLREPVTACFNAPPRHGKTELILHAVPYILQRRPHWTIGYASHSASVAWSKSRLARDYAIRAGIKLRGDTNSVHEWRTVEGGGMLAAGVMGSWTGQGVNVLFIDDPYSDRQDAESPLIRSRVIEWFQSVANTRVEPNGSILPNHTRWHERDLTGFCLSELGYEEVNLPAIDEHGNALWPERWPLDALERKRRGVGAYDWAALYLGRPVPKGGEVFRTPARYEEPAIAGARIVIGCDPAGSEAASSNHTAAVVLAVQGIGAEATADVIDVIRRHGETKAIADELEALQRKWGAPLTIEASRDGKAIARALRTSNQRLIITEVAPFASKFIRAQPLAGAWNEGRVRVPLRSPWLDDYLHEFSKFTGVEGGTDDQVDATAYAWNAASVAPREWTESYE
jgi:predicted phage terminase large subunit-like protein